MAGFYIQIKGLEDAQKILAGIADGSKKAIVRALNKTVGIPTGGVQSDAVKAVAGKINLTQKDIKKSFEVKKATYTDLSAYVRSTGKPTPLGRFIRTRQTSKGISVQVKRSRPRTVIRHAFFITAKKGSYKGVYWRVGRHRYPIKQRYGPRVPDIFENTEVMQPILQKAQERLDKNFNHEVEFLLETNK
jgi:hypothetical protein